MKKLIFALLLFLLSGIIQAQTRTDDLPYLYYYSRMTGGIVIERVDGSDSRLIGAEVIPANHTGIVGPGWSPTGKYFAGYMIDYGDYNAYLGSPFLIDTEGNNRLGYYFQTRTTKMEWSPDTRDLLFIIGASNSPTQLSYFFWLAQPEENQLLAEFAANYDEGPPIITDIHWENTHITFYTSNSFGSWGETHYFRVIMNFDGTVMKERISQNEFLIHYIPHNYDNIGEFDRLYSGISVSPSGRYTTYGGSEAFLTDTQLGTTVQLPKHSQQTICRDYVWHPDEYYMIMIGGTLIAGGGCSATVVGITTIDSRFWNELGWCSWNIPPCIGWLPQQVDVASLSLGQSNTVLLAPIGFDTREDEYGTNAPLEMNATSECNEDYVTRNLRDVAGNIVFNLHDLEKCGYGHRKYEAKWNVVYASNVKYGLLAMSDSYRITEIWQICDKIAYPALKIDSSGYQLKFTPDGEYLYTRNHNAWRIYSVQDILEHAGDVCAAQPNH